MSLVVGKEKVKGKMSLSSFSCPGLVREEDWHDRFTKVPLRFQSAVGGIYLPHNVILCYYYLTNSSG